MEPSFGSRKVNGKFFYERVSYLFGRANPEMREVVGRLQGAPRDLSHDDPALRLIDSSSGNQRASTCMATPFSWLACCPKPEVLAADGEVAPCGAPHRGKCVSTSEWLQGGSRRFPARPANMTDSGLGDYESELNGGFDRLRSSPLWWLGIGGYKCECFGNFDGMDCGMCKIGWFGKECDIPYVRRHVSLSDLTFSGMELAHLKDAYSDTREWMFLKVQKRVPPHSRPVSHSARFQPARYLARTSMLRVCPCAPCL